VGKSGVHTYGLAHGGIRQHPRFHNSLLLSNMMPFTESGRRRELTTRERSRIVEARNRAASWRQIEREFPITARGAKKVFDHWIETGSLRHVKHKGLHKKLSKSDERYLLQLATRNPRPTLAEIVADSQLKISECTAGNLLRRHQFYVHLTRQDLA